VKESDNLLEMILLQAEVLELKANPPMAMGTSLKPDWIKTKSCCDPLVLNGTLQAGMTSLREPVPKNKGDDQL
jgi:hypothetical protein